FLFKVASGPRSRRARPIRRTQPFSAFFFSLGVVHMTQRLSLLWHFRGVLVLLGLALPVPFLIPAGETPTTPAAPEWTKALTWRAIGPAAMAGRITAIAASEKDPAIYYVASASGGLVKTANAGITFQHQFDHEKTVSIGDVCVAPSDSNIVWV